MAKHIVIVGGGLAGTIVANGLCRQLGAQLRSGEVRLTVIGNSETHLYQPGLLYVPFGRTRLWRRVAGRQVPEWAQEFGANTWAQFFIKFAAAHPAVTCVTPATSKAKNMLDNMGAAVGELPDEAMQRRMVELVESLPSA